MDSGEGDDIATCEGDTLDMTEEYQGMPMVDVAPSVSPGPSVQRSVATPSSTQPLAVEEVEADDTARAVQVPPQQQQR